MPEAGSNGYPNAQRWVTEYERHEAEKQALAIEFAQKVANGPGKHMKETIARAKEDGIPVKVIRAALLERKHLRNAAKVRDKLEEETQDELDVLRKSLAPVADLPIFGAAIEKAEAAATERKAARNKARSAAVDSLTDDDADLRPRHLRNGDDDPAAAIAAGIKPLVN